MMTEPTEPKSKLRQRTEGRLDRSRDPAILDAALTILTELGYDATNMNDIAARAGVGKAAIYRRWSSKAALITDALVHWRPNLRADDAPDTGSLLGDLDALVEQIKRSDDSLVSSNVILRVAVEAAHDRELASALDELLFLRGRRVVSTLLQQAIARGEIPADRDTSLATDVIVAMSLMRAIGGQDVDAGFIRRVIDELLLPALQAGLPLQEGRRDE